jgi:uncharacterized heparinase superfamily protein
MYHLFIRYWNTVRFLKLVQILGRIKNKLPLDHRKFSKPQITDIRPVSGYWVHPIFGSQRMVSENTFRFLNITKKISGPSDWNNTKRTKLWLYHLHYFDDLISYNYTTYIELHKNLIQKWINENPIGLGVGWEPYPTSRRIVNWIKWAMLGNKLKSDWISSLNIQVNVLLQNIEYHLLGNHLFANAKALVFAGLFFKGNIANKWYKKGMSIINAQISEQVLSDGGHFELSTMYHAIFLEDLLDLINIHKSYGLDKPKCIQNKMILLLNWLSTMSHPDGGISFFNDATLDASPTVHDLIKYYNRLGNNDYKYDKKPQHILKNSGYTRIESGPTVVLIDHAKVGPNYLPGHAHADTLSFELSIFGQRFIVNSGTSIYGSSKSRQSQRSTSSHSTIMIDGYNSSDVWDGFRVGRRARIIDFRNSYSSGKYHISATHDGYRFLPGKPIHQRKWVMTSNSLLIYDYIMGRGIHKIESVYPIHPKVTISRIETNKVELHVQPNIINFVVKGEGDLIKKKSFYHPEFGLSESNFHLVYKFRGTLPTEIVTQVVWG